MPGVFFFAKILAWSLFSFPCLIQNLSTTPGQGGPRVASELSLERLVSAITNVRIHPSIHERPLREDPLSMFIPTFGHSAITIFLCFRGVSAILNTKLDDFLENSQITHLILGYLLSYRFWNNKSQTRIQIQCSLVCF